MVLRSCLLSALMVVLLSGCHGGDGSPSGAASSGTPVASTDPGEVVKPEPGSAEAADVTGRFGTGTKPCGILGAAGRIWVSNYGDDTLVSLDPRSGELSRPIDVGASPCGLAFGAGSIWVESFGDFTVSRVSVRTRQVQATYDVGFSPYDVTFAAGAAWVTNNGDGTVSRIDAATGEVRAVRTGGTPIGIAPAGGLLWVGTGAGGIVALDPVAGRVRERIPTDGPAGWTAYDRGRVWVNAGQVVLGIDPATGTVDQELPVGERPADGTVVDGTLWVPDRDGLLYRFGTDGSAQGTVASTVTDPFVVTGFRGLLWAADFAGSEVVRIDPARIP